MLAPRLLPRRARACRCCRAGQSPPFFNYLMMVARADGARFISGVYHQRRRQLLTRIAIAAGPIDVYMAF
jgi:hypothetical protein